MKKMEALPKKKEQILEAITKENIVKTLGEARLPAGMAYRLALPDNR